MNAKYENKLSTGLAVDTVLEQNSTIWNGVPAIVAGVAKLRTHLAAINLISQGLSTGTKGVTLDKKNARIAMAQAAAEVAGAGFAFATANNDGELQAKCNFTAGAILRMRDTESAIVCQQIHDAVNGHLPDYGVTAGTLSALQDKITAYNQRVSKPRATRSNNRAAGQMLKAEFAGLDAVCEQELDKLLLKFKGTQPAFYEAYVAAREVVDNPGGRAAKPVVLPVPVPLPLAA